jgi:hypothetical protein
MRTFSGTLESIMGGARRLVGRSAPADTRRESFAQEFGQHPPYREASTSQREQFAQNVVTPELSLRARAVSQANQAGGQQLASGAMNQPHREASEAFARAYQVAVDMGLAEKGRTYRDYLDA